MTHFPPRSAAAWLVVSTLVAGCAGPRGAASATSGQGSAPTESRAAAPESRAAAPESRAAAPGPEPAAEGWIQLFNGRDLTGWTPKFTGHPLGVNLHDTFRVEDGLLKVSYDRWGGFHGEFGHLHYEHPLSDYRLRIEYRFVGEQVPGGPGWAFRNSGVMLHGQDPRTLALGQEFPCSIEAQMLGGDGDPSHARSTANLCTPGTHVVMGGELVTRHCTSSSSATYHGDQWVVMELVVRGNGAIQHIVDGAVVLEYERAQLDPGDPHAAALLAAGQGPLLAQGYVSLQAESHPLEVRSLAILPLEPEDTAAADGAR